MVMFISIALTVVVKKAIRVNNMNKTCGTCEYGYYDKMQGYVCVNSDSEYCADFVDHDFNCDEWEDGNG